MKKLLLIIVALGFTPVQAATHTYSCKDQGKTTQLKVDDTQNTLSWKGTTFKITETECGKAGWHVEKDGVLFDFCTATKEVADFDFNGRPVMWDMKR